MEINGTSRCLEGFGLGFLNFEGDVSQNESLWIYLIEPGKDIIYDERYRDDR
jgi:hypothetical protein